MLISSHLLRMDAVTISCGRKVEEPEEGGSVDGPYKMQMRKPHIALN